jgi:hypothetical protein
MVSKIVKAHQEVRDLVLLFQGIPEQIPMEMKMTFCRQSQEAHKNIKQFLLAHGYVALTNDMLKAYKVAQV